SSTSLLTGHLLQPGRRGEGTSECVHAEPVMLVTGHQVWRDVLDRFGPPSVGTHLDQRIDEAARAEDNRGQQPVVQVTRPESTPSRCAGPGVGASHRRLAGSAGTRVSIDRTGSEGPPAPSPPAPRLPVQPARRFGRTAKDPPREPRSDPSSWASYRR